MRDDSGDAEREHDGNGGTCGARCGYRAMTGDESTKLAAKRRRRDGRRQGDGGGQSLRAFFPPAPLSRLLRAN